MVGIPLCTNCASLVADFYLFCYEKISFTYKQALIIVAIISKSRYLENIDYFNITTKVFQIKFIHLDCK